MLTIKKIEAAKAQCKPYKLPDGGSLYLYITTSGSKSFRFDYQFNGKRKTLTIGKYPYISLPEAREEREIAKKMLAHGQDPSVEKKKGLMLANIEQQTTFQKITMQWFETKKKAWSKQTAGMIINYFQKDIFPLIGACPINQIKPHEMLICLKSIEARGALEIAKKMRQRCSEVFQYAIIIGVADNNPARELAKAMVNYTSKNYPFLVESEMIEFLKALKGYSGNIIVRCATELLILTALRTVELRTLKWNDVDFNEKIINIREEIMKQKRKHIVPLSTQALTILEFLKAISGNNEFVFTGRNDPKTHISNGAVLGLIKRLGFSGRASGHGFRHQFSTVLNEHGFNHDWIEKQLNHESSSIRGIYNHAQYLEGRREMMQWYADYIDKLSA